jgi:hypothetical protein
MNSDRSSRLSQNVVIPPSKRSTTSDGEPPAGNGTAIRHVDTNVKKTVDELVPDPVEIEPSIQEGEEGAEEGSVPHSPESDKVDGLHDVSLNGDNPNVGLHRFPLLSEHYEAQEDIQASPLNERPAPGRNTQKHDTSMQQSEPVISPALDVRTPSSPRRYLINR